MSPRHFDNYATRLLLGRKVLSGVRLGELTEDHFRAALAILERFDVVLVLRSGQNLDTDPLRALRGWPATDFGQTRGNYHSSVSKVDSIGGGDEAVYRERLALFESFTTYDRRLLAAAERLANRTVTRRAAKHVYPVVEAVRLDGDQDLWNAVGDDSTCRSGFSPPNAPVYAPRPPPPGASPVGRIKLINVGHGTSGTRSMYDALCDRGYVTLHFKKWCNLEKLTEHRRDALLKAHFEVIARFSEASWTPEHKAETVKMIRNRKFPKEKKMLILQAMKNIRGTCLSSPESPPGSRVTHEFCRAKTWIAETARAVEAVVALGAEALLDAPYDRWLEAIVAYSTEPPVVVHTLRPAASWALSRHGNHSGVEWATCKRAYVSRGASPFDPVTCFDAAVAGGEDPAEIYLDDLFEPLPRDPLEALGAAYALEQYRVRTVAQKLAPKKYLALCWWDGPDRSDRFDALLRDAAHTRYPTAAYVAGGDVGSSTTPDFGDRVAPRVAGMDPTETGWVHRKPSPNAATVPMSHVITTRLQLGQESFPVLLESRLHLFAAITLPSVIAQTSSEFVWLIYAAVDKWPKRLREWLQGLVAPFPHVKIVQVLPNATSNTPRDFTVDEHLVHAGFGRAGKLRLLTLLDGDDAIHYDMVSALQKAARAVASDGNVAILCSRTSWVWGPTKRKSLSTKYGTAAFMREEEYCLTPGFTVVRPPGAEEARGIRHVNTREEMWKRATFEIIGAPPLRARTLTSHGAKGLDMNQSATDEANLKRDALPPWIDKIRPLGFFTILGRVNEANAFLVENAKGIFKEQAAAHEACHEGFSCKPGKANKMMSKYYKHTFGDSSKKPNRNA